VGAAVSRTPKPILHRRDHEHGGADTVGIHYESVGSGGGGGGSPQAVYSLAYSAAPTGLLRNLNWTYDGGDAALLDLTDPAVPVTVDAGVYSYLFYAGCAVIITTGEYARFVFVAAGSSGFDASSAPIFPVQAAISQVIGAHATLVAHQDAGGVVYATVTNESAVSRDFTGTCFVQRLS
jgi:hypothetical protein